MEAEEQTIKAETYIDMNFEAMRKQIDQLTASQKPYSLLLPILSIPSTEALHPPLSVIVSILISYNQEIPIFKK